MKRNEVERHEAWPRGLTMSDEQEAREREVSARGSGKTYCAWEELDATRAKLAEAERKLAAYSAPQGGLAVFADAIGERERLQYEPHLRREMRRASEAEAALAAAQARVAELTAALRDLLYTERADNVAQAGKYEAWQRAFLRAEAAPAQQPEQAALRAMLDGATQTCWQLGFEAEELTAPQAMDRKRRECAEVVSRILRDGGAK